MPTDPLVPNHCHSNPWPVLSSQWSLFHAILISVFHSFSDPKKEPIDSLQVMVDSLSSKVLIILLLLSLLSSGPTLGGRSSFGGSIEWPPVLCVASALISTESPLGSASASISSHFGGQRHASVWAGERWVRPLSRYPNDSSSDHLLPTERGHWKTSRAGFQADHWPDTRVSIAHWLKRFFLWPTGGLRLSGRSSEPHTVVFSQHRSLRSLWNEEDEEDDSTQDQWRGHPLQSTGLQVRYVSLIQ